MHEMDIPILFNNNHFNCKFFSTAHKSLQMYLLNYRSLDFASSFHDLTF